MLSSRIRLGLLATIAATILMVPASVATAATIRVTTTVDEYGAGAGCSLREAVTAANTDTAFGGCPAGSGADEVRLRKGSVYARSIDGNDEDGNATGDLDIYSQVAIGPKKGKATIDALGFDRVIDVLTGGDLTLSRLTATGASETYPGSLVAGTGVRSYGKLKTSKVKIIGNQSIGNSSNNGGGILIGTGKAVLDQTKVKDNLAGNVGGGIATYQGKLTIRRSTIAGNESGYVGGGMYLGGSLSDPDVVRIKDSTVSDNRAGANGGGIYASIYGTTDGGTDAAQLTNVTISGNEAAGSGGGIYQYVGQVSLESSTVTNNTADTGALANSDHGGGVAGSVGFVNSIVFGNRDLNPVDPQADCYAAGSAGNSVVGDGTGCFQQGSDTTDDPKLKPLAQNGGPTATHALKKRSAAIGLAKRKSSPRKDQRGVKRDKDPDSGAYEYK